VLSDKELSRRHLLGSNETTSGLAVGRERLLDEGGDAGFEELNAERDVSSVGSLCEKR
jgi:hypothetical protein